MMTRKNEDVNNTCPALSGELDGGSSIVSALSANLAVGCFTAGGSPGQSCSPWMSSTIAPERVTVERDGGGTRT